MSILPMNRFLKPIIRIQFTLTLWNPTIHPVTHLTRVPVTKDYTIRDPLGQTMTAEVIEMNQIDRMFDLLFEVSSNSVDNSENSWPREFSRSSISIQSGCACIWL